MPLPGALHKGRAALSRSSSFHKDSAGLVPPFIFCGFFFFVIIISSLLFLLFFFFSFPAETGYGFYNTAGASIVTTVLKQAVTFSAALSSPTLAPNTEDHGSYPQ